MTIMDHVAGTAHTDADAARALHLFDDTIKTLRDRRAGPTRSTVLASLSQSLDASLGVEACMEIVLSQIVPALASTATIALLDEGGLIEFVRMRSSVPGNEPGSADLAPSALPSAHFSLLRQALSLAPETLRAAVPLADGALRMLPLCQGDQLLGGLWIDGEVTLAGSLVLADLAAYASAAFVNARLRRALRREADQHHLTQARLEDGHRRKVEFLAMLSHELRNPLAPIRNALEVIRLIAPPDPQLQWAADVTDRQVRQLTRLVDELLDVARISQGKIELQPQCVDLVDLVTRGVAAHRQAIDGRRQSLMVEMPETPVNLNGDPTRLAQVVDDLLCNAIKYTPEGGALAVVVTRESTSRGEFAVLAISDDGIGIEPELLPHVFDLFEQGKRALDRTQGGLGVGLTLVQRLVELHGGDVEVSSEGLGQGAQFRVRLPCLVEVDGAAVSLDVSSPRLVQAPVRRKVLVVEDHADVAETTTMLLRLSGHQVRCVKDGLQALQAATEFEPDVVLLDIGLPLMDGYEVARRLRRLPQTREALLIALTGYGQESDRQRGRDAGFDGHLLKPVDPHLLSGMIMAPHDRSLSAPSPT